MSSLTAAALHRRRRRDDASAACDAHVPHSHSSSSPPSPSSSSWTALAARVLVAALLLACVLDHTAPLGFVSAQDSSSSTGDSGISASSPSSGPCLVSVQRCWNSTLCLTYLALDAVPAPPELHFNDSCTNVTTPFCVDSFDVVTNVSHAGYSYNLTTDLFCLETVCESMLVPCAAESSSSSSGAAESSSGVELSSTGEAPSSTGLEASSSASEVSSSAEPPEPFVTPAFSPTGLPGDVPTGGPLVGGAPSSSTGWSGSSSSGASSSTGFASSSTGAASPSGPDAVTPVIDASSLVISPTTLLYNRGQYLSFTLTLRVQTGYSGLRSIALGFELNPYDLSFSRAVTTSLSGTPWQIVGFTRTIETLSDCSGKILCAACDAPLCSTCCVAPFSVDSTGGRWIQIPLRIEPANVWFTNQPQIFPPCQLSITSVSVTGVNTLSTPLTTALSSLEAVNAAIITAGGSVSSAQLHYRAFMYMPASVSGPIDAAQMVPNAPSYQIECTALEGPAASACGFVSSAGGQMLSIISPICPSARCAELFLPYYRKCLEVTLNNQGLTDTSAVLYSISRDNAAMDLEVSEQLIETARALYESAMSWRTPDAYYPAIVRPVDGSRTCPQLETEVATRCQLSTVGTGLTVAAEGIKTAWYNFPSVASLARCNYPQSCGPFLLNYTTLCLDQSFPWAVGANRWATGLLNLVAACTKSVASVADLRVALAATPRAPLLLLDIPTPSPPAALNQVSVGGGIIPDLELFRLKGGRELLVMWTPSSIGVANAMSYTIRAQRTSDLPAEGSAGYTTASSWKYSVSVSASANAAVISTLTTAQSTQITANNLFSSEFYPPLLGSWTVVIEGRNEFGASFSYKLPTVTTPFNPMAPAPGRQCPLASPTPLCGSGVTGSNPALRTVSVAFAPLVRDTQHYWNPDVCTSVYTWDPSTPSATTQCTSPFFSNYPRPDGQTSYNALSYVTYVVVVWPGLPTVSYADSLLTQVACVVSRRLVDEGTAASEQPKVPCTISRLAPGQRYRAAMMAINPFGSPTDLSAPVDLTADTAVPTALPALVVDNTPSAGGFNLRVNVVGNSVDSVGAIYIVSITCITCTSGPFMSLFTLTSPTSFLWSSSAPSSTTNGATRMIPQAGFLYRFSLGAANKTSYVLSSGAVPDVVSPPLFAYFTPLASLPPASSLTWGTQTKADGYVGNSAELSWNAPTNVLGLQRVLFYRVVLTTTDSSFLRSADINQERIKFNGLPAGKTFNAFVSPVSAAGVGPVASSLSGLATDAFVPLAPTVRSLIALAPLSLINTTALLRPNMSCAHGWVYFNRTEESFAMTNYTFAYNASDPADVAFIDSLSLPYTLQDGQNFTWAFNISLGLVTTSVNGTVYTCVNLTYPVADYPILETTILSPTNGSVLQIRFDGPTDMGVSSPTLTPAQIADSYDFSTGGTAGWLKLYNTIPWSYVSADGLTVTAGTRDLLLDEIKGGWDTSWNADGSVLSLTFRNWQQPDDWNITLIDPITFVESWYLHSPVPTVGSTFAVFRNGITIRRVSSAVHYFSGGSNVKLGGSWNLTQRAFTTDPLQQGLLTTLAPSSNAGVGPLVAWGSYTQPLQQYLRLSLTPLQNEISWWGNLGNSGMYTLNCTARLGFVYPYAKTGTLEELQRFLHNTALTPGSSTFLSSQYDYYNAWKLSGYTFVYTAPFQARGKDDVVTCSLWTSFAANYSGPDRSRDQPYYNYMLDQRQFPIRVISVNREPTLLLPQGKITFPSTLNVEARAAGYDPNPISVAVDTLRYLNFSLQDLDATMGTATTFNAHSAVRVLLRINSHALSPYAAAIRVANTSATGVALNVSSVRSQVLSTSDPLTSDGTPTVRLSREVGVDAKELLIVGPFVDVAAIMASFVQVSFKQADTAAHASALSGSTVFPSSAPDLVAPPHATGASLANVILTPYALFPALTRSFLSVTVNDLGNLGSDVPLFAGSTQLMHFEVTCSGANVAAPAITAATFSDAGDAVIVTWSTPVSVAVTGGLVQSTAACLALFDDTFFTAVRGSSSSATTPAAWQSSMASSLSPTALTNMPTCTLLASNIVRVGLATGHTLGVGFAVAPRTGAAKRCPGSTNAATVSAQLTAPLLPIAPTVRIFGPTLVSVCDDILFTTRVTGLARSSSATYDWSFTSLIMPDLVISNAFPRATTSDYPLRTSGSLPFVMPGGETLSIPRGVLRPDVTYRIGVTVTNRFGIVSERAEHSFTPTARPVPTVQIVMEPGIATVGGLATVFVRGSSVLGAHSLYTPATPALAPIVDPFILHSMVNFSSCHPSVNRGLKYTWTVTTLASLGVPAPTILSTNTQPSLTLDQNTLYDDVDYTVKLSVVAMSSIGFPTAEQLEGSYTAVFRIQAAPLTYAFTKGDAQVVSVSDPLQIETVAYDQSKPYYGTLAQPTRTCTAVFGSGECINKYQWTCITASGNPCVNELALSSAAPVLSLSATSILSFPAGTLAPDTYRFSLVLTAPSAVLGARITAPFNTLTHTVTITPAPLLAGPVLTLPPLFTLSCPVLNNGAFEFGLPILNHDQPLTVSVNHTLRAAGNTVRYTWLLSSAFNAATDYAADGSSIESATLNTAYGVPGAFTNQSSLQFNAQASRNYWTPGTFLRVHVVVTESNPALNFNSSANARCSYFVHAPPSGGSLVISSTRLGSGGSLVTQTPVYLSAPHWSHSLLSNPFPFNPFGSTSATNAPSLAFVNYAFYIRTASGQTSSFAKYTPYTFSAEIPDPNVRFLRAGYTSNVGVGGFITSLPGGTYYLGVLVRDVYGGASVAEQLVTVSSGSSDPVAGAAAPDAFMLAQSALVNTQLDGLTTGAIAGGSDAILDLASNTAILLNSFSEASQSLTGYPTGVTASTGWMMNATAIRTQLLAAVRSVVKPLLASAPKTTSLPQSQILLLTSRLVASPAQMDLSQASTLLQFLEDYLSLSALRTTGVSSMSVSDYSLVLQMLGVVATSSAFVASPPTSVPVLPSTSSSVASSSTGAAAARRLFAVSDDPSIVVVGGGGSSSLPSGAGRAMLDQIYATYSTALIYSELFILTSQTTTFFNGTASGATPVAGLGVNAGVTRFINGGSTPRITVAPGACYLTVRSISTDTTPLLLDARFIYIYTGADLYSWATPADAPEGPSNPNNSSYVYNLAPTVSLDLAYGSAPSIGQSYSTHWGGPSSILPIRYEYTVEFIVQFATSTLVTDTLWEFNCQRFDASSGAWTSSDVSTTIHSRPNPWSISCVTRTPGVVTVAAYSTWIPPNWSSSGGSGSSNQSSPSSSTGSAAPILLLDNKPLSNTNLQLFLIVAGCIAVGTSCLVGLLACWCQRRSRAKEADRRAAEKVRKLEMAKTRALREAAGNPASSKKKKAPKDNKKTVVPAGGSAGVIKKPALLSQGSFADLHKSQQSAVPLGPVSPQNNSAMGASGWMAAGALSPLGSPSGAHENMDANEDIHFSEDLYEDGAGGDEPVAIRIAGAEEEQKGSPGLAASPSGRDKKRDKKHGSGGKKDAKAARARGRSAAAAPEDDAPRDFDSDEEGHAKYNRHDQIHIDIAQEQPLIGETGLELNSDYSNMWYDPVATAAAAAELAALTGQSVAEVSAMLRAQQAAELETGVGGASTIYSYDEPSPSKKMAAGGGASSVAAAGAAASAATAAGAASINYDDFHVTEHAPTRTYDDSMLGFHGPLNNDPYLLAVYSPSHASNPAMVPPPDLLRRGLMPGRMVDTSYSRPLVPAAWRLLHGHSPWGQTISFRVDSMPRWWRHHKGLDVSETKEELRRARMGARRVARKPKPTAAKKHIGVYAERYQQAAAAASASSSSSSSSSKPSVLRASTAAPHRATKSDLRRQLSAAPVSDDDAAASSGAGFNFVPPSAAASKQARKDAAASKAQGLRPTRLQGVGTAALDTSLRLQNQRSLTNLVRDEPAPSSSPHSTLASPSANFHALPSLGEDGDGDGDEVGPLTERKDDERPRAGGAGQLSSRRHRNDEEGGRGGGYSGFSAGGSGGGDDEDGMQLMGGGGDGASTYRGYSSFQPSAFELEEPVQAPAKNRRGGGR